MDTFFDTSQFMAHGNCYVWRPEILWLHVISDVVIAAAYFAIPVTLLYIIRQRPQAFPNRWIAYMFSVLISTSGLLHIMSIVTIWYPIYFWEGLMKAATASVSFSAAILFVPLAPRFLQSIHSPPPTALVVKGLVKDDEAI